MKTTWLNIMDERGRTPLDRALNSGHRGLAEVLLRQEQEDQSALKSASPIHRATYLGLTDAVKTLLRYSNGAPTFDESMETPLHRAVREGHKEIVEALLPASNVNAVSGVGLTPLHWAAITGDTIIAEKLLAHGADPSMSDLSIDGLSPKEMARVMEYDDLYYMMDAACRV
ncbi:MAG: ankyrin repeat domain-containing protein [Candidatus Hydrogenedentes bacterium]|nr:ankyrin repeat domain-containing protein [Candidatus Hydrogenedentota bacterium]